MLSTLVAVVVGLPLFAAAFVVVVVVVACVIAGAMRDREEL